MRYTLESFKDIVEGRSPLPNPRPLEDRRALNDIAAFGHMLEPVWGYVNNKWTQFFLRIYYGTGIAVIHGVGAFEFALCKHEKVPGPDANPQRGWHPGYCRLCGLDMTVDSGD